MTTTEERTSTLAGAEAAAEVGQRVRKPLGVWRALVLLLAGASICAFSIHASGVLAGPAEPEFVNVNSATTAELKDLPSVDQKIAEAIVAGRPFKSVDDLLRVKGIGEKKLEKIRPFVTAE